MNNPAPPEPPALAALRQLGGVATSAELQARLGVSQPTVSRALAPEEIRSAWVGPGGIIAYLSARYPNGRQILWVNAGTGLYKLDAETYEVLQEMPRPQAARYTREWADEMIAALDADNSAAALPTATAVMTTLQDLSGVYVVIGANNWMYVAGSDGSITAYGDAVEGDPASPIAVMARFAPPPWPGRGARGAMTWKMPWVSARTTRRGPGP
jgi:DNA-binding transcriptional ArsR family regulator